MVRYAITNFTGDGPGPLPSAPGHLADLHRRCRHALLHWAQGGVDYIQLREKALSPGDLFHLAERAMALLHTLGDPRPQLLLNHRPDVAIAARTDGLHLTGAPGELSPEQVRALFRHAHLPRYTVSVSCHTAGEAAAAHSAGADLVLFGPVFEKSVAGHQVQGGRGLGHLAEACVAAAPCPVLALGGVTAANTRACLQAGAAGIAAIRLFTPAA